MRLINSPLTATKLFTWKPRYGYIWKYDIFQINDENGMNYNIMRKEYNEIKAKIKL